jgi:alkylation response protein AidB-like acyl-CoA dehydrogenase
MKDELTEEQIDIKKAAREFAIGEFPNVAKDADVNEEFPKDLFKKACRNGFIGVYIGEKYGGAGLGLFEHALILEEFWRVDPGCGNILLSTIGSQLIQLYGTEEQKRRFLPPLSRGEAMMGIPCYSEFEFRGDLLKIGMSAKKDQDNGFSIHGEKALVINGTLADHLILTCLTNPNSNLIDGRYSNFIVSTRDDRMCKKALKNKLGIRATDFAYISLNNVRVSKEDLIGKENEGYEQIDNFLDWLKVCAAAQGLGVSQGALDQSIKYARTRMQFNVPIGRFEAIQFKIADMATKVESARWLCYRAARKIDRGEEDKKLISMAKWYTAQICLEVTGEAIQIHGGYGFIKDLDVERFYRDAQSLSFVSGRKYFEKKAIAENLLGKC